MFELCVDGEFDSAHNLREYHGACERLHGHTYRVRVAMRASETGPDGMVRDFKEIKEALGRVIDQLDHQYINEIPPFDTLNPTAENLARFIHQQLTAQLGSGVHRVTVWETPKSSASYWEGAE